MYNPVQVNDRTIYWKEFTREVGAIAMAIISARQLGKTCTLFTKEIRR